MPEYPGLPRLTKTVWKVTALLGLGTILIQGISVLPVLGSAYFVGPELASYGVFAFIGWSVLYIADIMAALRHYGFEFFQEIATSFSGTRILYVFLLVGIYLNAVIGVAIVASTYLGTTLGLPFVALVVALLYPAVDFELAKTKISPGFLVLAAVLFVFHVVGVLRSVTADAVIQGMQRGQPPGAGG